MSKEEVESQSNKLVGLVDSATPEDLASLRTEIRKQEGRLKALKSLETVIAAAVGEEKVKKTYKRREEDDTPSSPEKSDPVYLLDKRRKVAQVLRNAPANGQKLMKECGIMGAKLAEIMNCEYFQDTPTVGWTLTAAGRQKFCNQV